jgi:hypothetical protein
MHMQITDPKTFPQPNKAKSDTSSRSGTEDGRNTVIAKDGAITPAHKGDGT